MQDTTIKIDIARYQELLDTEKFMRALEAAGVDNWEGYDIAQDRLEEWKREAETIEPDDTFANNLQKEEQEDFDNELKKSLPAPENDDWKEAMDGIAY